MSQSDLTACLCGDKNAWDAFVERYMPVIFAAVQRTIRRYKADRDPDQIHDSVQEVFVRLVKQDYRLLRSYDPDRSSLSTWLTIVARSTTIDGLRRKRLNTVPLDEHAESVSASPDSGSELPEVEIPEALLSPRQRLVLRLLFDREMSVADAAKVLGVEPQTVRSAKHKALQKLRRFFKRDG